MMEIRLEGVAGKRFGYKHTLDVKNPNQAIRALCQLLPGFRAFLTSAHEHGIYFQILTNNREEGIGYDDLELGCRSFALVPVITGAAKFFQNLGMILLGVALVAFSFGAFGVAFGAAGTISAGIQTAAMALGFGLIFTGVAGLFAPGVPQEGKTEGAEADDAIFNGATATAPGGTPIPLLYGTYLATSMPVVSSYINNETGYLMTIVSEGPIAGLPNGTDRDLYFNGLQAGSSPANSIQLTDGNQTSQVVNIVQPAGFHIAAGVTLAAGDENTSIPTPEVIRSFAQTGADTLKIRIQYGPCYQIRTSSPKDGGGTKTKYRDYDSDQEEVNGGENPLEYRVEVINGNGDVFFSRTFEETSAKSVKINNLTVGITNQPVPIAIRVKRLDRGAPPTPDSYSGGRNVYSFQWVKGDVTFVSADVTWAERLVYPHTALAAVRFDASEFASMPSIQGLFKGIIVPTLNSSLSLQYAWSDNPAWVLLDLLINPRYGLGGRTYTTTGPNPETRNQVGIRLSDIDKASFLRAAQYCDRNNIRFNAYIDRQADALDLIRSVASSFNAMLVYSGGYVTLVVDEPYTDVANLRLFTESNTIQESDDSGVTSPCFTYEGTSRKARTTAVEVGYIEPSEFYAEKKAVIEDLDAIERYGYNLAQIRALGCTSRAQAERLGRYTIASNLFCTETVTFKVASEGAMLLPGDVCLIGDPLKTRMTSGGRITAATSNSIITDRNIENANGDLYVYTYGASGVCQRNKVSSVSGNRIQISGSFATVPTYMQLWVLVDEANKNQFRRYRIQTIKESNTGSYEVIAIQYSDQKFDYINTGSGNFSNPSRTFYSSGNVAIDQSSINFSIRSA